MSGKVAVVTGGSRGIGRDIALVLAESGYRVVVAARTVSEGDFHIPGSLESTIRDIRSAGGVAVPVACDLAFQQGRKSLVESAVATFGGIDLLVNNAGIAPPGRLETMKASHFELAWRINVEAPFFLSRMTIPHLRARGGGAIVNISSGASKGPGPGPYSGPIAGGTVYGLTKAALERMTQGLAAELAGEPISVAALSPSKMIYVGGTVYVTKTDPAFSFTGVNGRRKEGRIMGDACLAIATAPAEVTTGRLYSDESALSDLAGATDFDAYPSY